MVVDFLGIVEGRLLWWREVCKKVFILRGSILVFFFSIFRIRVEDWNILLVIRKGRNKLRVGYRKGLCGRWSVVF